MDTVLSFLIPGSSAAVGFLFAWHMARAILDTQKAKLFIAFAFLALITAIHLVEFVLNFITSPGGFILLAIVCWGQSRSHLNDRCWKCTVLSHLLFIAMVICLWMGISPILGFFSSLVMR